MKTPLASFLFLPLAASAADTNALPALAPAYGELPPTFWEQHQTLIVIGGFLFIVAQSLFLWKMLMRLQPAVEPPENLARAALNQLLDEPEDGKLLSEVPQILRRYIGAAFQLRGEAATTSEFTAEIMRHEPIGQALAGKIASFLRACDDRKFAPEKDTASLDAVEQALEFITQLERRRPASANQAR